MPLAGVAASTADSPAMDTSDPPEAQLNNVESDTASDHVADASQAVAWYNKQRRRFEGALAVPPFGLHDLPPTPLAAQAPP